jgi:WXXGXW repeat (2 copies)
MTARFSQSALVVFVIAGGISLSPMSWGQEASREQPSEQSAAAVPSLPQGVEVLARGPVHEAFATPTTEPAPTKPVLKAPPTVLDELPPNEKPEGATWIGGYWAWDDERSDFLWVSGIWRTPPPGQRWVAGYWRADGQQWHWVPGFWTAAQEQSVNQPVTYLPEPPALPQVAGPGTPPSPESFYVPGHWAWHEAGYTTVGGETVWRSAGYAWTAGYWAQVQPGYVWVSAHYRWTPGGYVFIPGYWDLILADRGVLYAPVLVDTAMVGPTFVYTPAYAVRHEIIIDAMFVRPSYCHYYFGDYYGPAYRQLGYESCVVYSRHHYDAIFVYERYSHRNEPRWETVQIDLCLARHAGQAPCPPRTLVQQNIIVQQNITNVRNVTVVNNTTNINRTTVSQSQVLVPSAQLAAAKGVHTIPLDTAARVQAKQQAQAIRQVGLQRHQIEGRSTMDKPTQPRVATLNLPLTQPVVSARATTVKAGDALKAATLATPNVTPRSSNAARPGTQAGLPSQQLATPLQTANRPPTGPPTAVNNPTRLQPPVAAQPSSPLPGQSITQGKSPLSPRSIQPSMATSPFQRLQPGPTGAFQRASPSQQPQPRPAPAQKKPDQPEKQPPAKE